MNMNMRDIIQIVEGSDLVSWLGCSVVKQPVYHGSPYFDGTEKPRMNYAGVFFVTLDKNYAISYARSGALLAYYARICNPADFRDEKTIQEAYSVYVNDSWKDDVDEPYDIEADRDCDLEWALLAAPAVVEHFVRKGHDGFVLEESNNGLTFAVISPDQLRLISVSGK